MIINKIILFSNLITNNLSLLTSNLFNYIYILYVSNTQVKEIRKYKIFSFIAHCLKN